MEKDNTRSVYKGLILYAEDLTHQKAMQIIKDNFKFKAILHDKDIDEKGELKKPHYHYIVKLDSTLTNSWLAKKLNIQVNYIQVIISLKGAYNYLTHKNNKDKFQYELSETFGDLEILTDKDDISNRDFKKLVYLMKTNHITTMKGLCQCAMDNDLLNTLRKNSYLFTQLLK